MRGWSSRVAVGLVSVAFVTGAVEAAEAPMQQVHGGAARAAATVSLPQVWSLAPATVLGAPAGVDASELHAMRAWNAAGRMPMRNGFARSLTAAVELRAPVLRRAAPSTALAGGLVGRSATGDAVWAGRLHVEGAYRLRAGLQIRGGADGATVVVTGSDRRAVGPVAVRPDAEGRFWTPSVTGPDIAVELRLPASKVETEAEVRIDKVVQIFDSRDSYGTGDQGCLRDAACYDDSTWVGITAARRGIARLDYMRGPSSFSCTGSLLNDNVDSSVIPYLLTANHCINTQDIADTLETYWDYIAPACDAAAPPLASLPRVDGATLLATSVLSDFAFLQLSALPPGERTLLGWTSESLFLGTRFARLSHPLGQSLAYSTTEFTFVPEPVCGTDLDGRPWGDQTKFFYQNPVFGGTRPGSSGSPLLLPGGIVVGQMLGWCGTEYRDHCDPNLDTVDGRFDAAYPEIHTWLRPQGGGSPRPPRCSPDADTLCINDQPGDRRFRIEVAYTSAAGAGQAKAHRLSAIGIARGGLFSFFSADNPELLVKVLNGCSLNDRYWVFTSAGTDVGVTITVTDMIANRTWTHTNPQGTPMPPVLDTDALPCDWGAPAQTAARPSPRPDRCLKTRPSRMRCAGMLRRRNCEASRTASARARRARRSAVSGAARAQRSTAAARR